MQVTVSEFASSKFLLLTLFIDYAITVRIPFSARCDVGNSTGVQVFISNDNVPGRYDLQHCIQRDLYTKWELGLYYLENNNEDECRSYIYTMGVYSKLHSRSEPVYINRTCDFGTTIMCFNYTMDLIFNGCYWVSSQLWKANHSFNQSDTVHYIHNNITKHAYLSNKATAQVLNNNDKFSILWFSGIIPITSFKLELCPANNTLSQECKSVERDCELRQWSVMECWTSMLRGEFQLLFTHTPDVAWTHGLLANMRISHFYFTVEEMVGAESGGAAAWKFAAAGAGLAAAAALLLAALMLLAALLLRRPALKRYPDRSLEPLREVSDEKAPQILLVYASDVMLEGRLLADLLTASGADVSDVQSARCSAWGAGAAAGWLRARLAEPAVRLLLLQSAAMRRTEEEFGGAVSTFGDTLVHLCVQHVYDSPTLKYDRYFIATVQSGGEVLPSALPFTRYPLPGAAALLLRDLQCAAPPPALAVLAAALRDLERGDL